MQQEGLLGGRPGPSAPRFSPPQPGGNAPFGLTAPPGPGNVLQIPQIELPLYGSLAIPEGAEEEGPPDGLTLDQAIDRLVFSNLDLRAKFQEIPMAEADVLTAGLRANPLLFADGQLVPYGSYTAQRPGGQTQYDLNITLPMDLNHKRRYRREFARRAMNVVEAQYQDAVRLTIDQLYILFVDVLAARETVRYAQASIQGLDQLLNLTEARLRQGEATQADVNRIRIQRDSARIGLAEAEATLEASRRGLAPLLNLSPVEAESIQLRGTILDRLPPPPPVDELIRLALAARPDFRALQLGTKAADAGLRLARAERFQDVYVLYQPFTLQNNRNQPISAGNSTSWALGLTVPLPIFDRNQGNIRRAGVNVGQARIQVDRQAQVVATEVRTAYDRYQTTRAAVDQNLPDAPARRPERSERLPPPFRAGRGRPRRSFACPARVSGSRPPVPRHALRHRRSMLELNTAVGERVLP